MRQARYISFVSTPPYITNLQTWQAVQPFRLIFWTRTADSNEEETLFHQGESQQRNSFLFNVTCPLVAVPHLGPGQLPTSHLVIFTYNDGDGHLASSISSLLCFLYIQAYSHPNSPSCRTQLCFSSHLPLLC
jgi:hypothetical protein